MKRLPSMLANERGETGACLFAVLQQASPTGVLVCYARRVT
jgi:hypothetical protein